MKSAFYLSIVVAGRNDNYGGDFDLRFKNWVAWVDYYANKYNLPCEFVFVNYNALVGRKPLKDTLTIKKNGLVTYRFIDVPGTFHQQLIEQNKRLPLPFFEYVAKNIGIQRATGEFILYIKPDILPDPAIFKFIACLKLDANTYYRVDRCDYTFNGAAKHAAQDLEKIKRSVFQIFKKGRTYLIDPKGITNIKTMLLNIRHFIYLQWNLFLPTIKWVENYYSIPVIYDNVVFKIHCNHGDFLMLHRSKWNEIRGYPQEMYHPVHTDSITIAMAYSSGLKEKVFFNPIYPAEYERRFTTDNSIPAIKTVYELFKKVKKCYKIKSQFFYNTENCGFADKVFTETTL